MTDPTEALEDLGTYLRLQRQMAKLSLRHLARMCNVSDSYLSQVERGLYQPSPEVLRAIGQGLGLAPDQLFRRMGWLPDESGSQDASVKDAIAVDKRLSAAQKAALLQLYHTMIDGS